MTLTFQVRDNGALRRPVFFWVMVHGSFDRAYYICGHYYYMCSSVHSNRPTGEIP